MLTDRYRIIKLHNYLLSLIFYSTQGFPGFIGKKGVIGNPGKEGEVGIIGGKGTSGFTGDLVSFFTKYYKVLLLSF